MSTRSGLIRASIADSSPLKTRKGVSPPRSPGRPRKSSPVSSKSPSRKSPGRKSASKFPARKSPSRTTKETNEFSAPKSQRPEPSALKSPIRRPAIKEVEIKLLKSDLSDGPVGMRSRRSEYSIKDIISNTTQNISSEDKVNGLEAISYKETYTLRSRQATDENLPRRSSRLRDITDILPDHNRSVSKSVGKSDSKSTSKSIVISDTDEDILDEDLKKVHAKSVTRKLSTPLRDGINKFVQLNRWEFGGRLGSMLLIFLMPVILFTSIILCNNSCTLNTFDLNAYKSLSEWYSLNAMLLVIGQYIIQGIFAILPIFGTKAYLTDKSGFKFCFNAIFSTVLTSFTLFTLSFLGILELESLLNEYLKMAIVSYMIAVLLSVIMYIKSLKVSSNLNVYGKTGYFFYDFWMGREIHPYIGKLNVKIWTSRISNISTLILALLILKQGITIHSKDLEEMSIQHFNQILKKVHLKPAVIVYSMMQIVYILNYIIKESKITSTFFWNSEGVGYLQIVSSSLYPYYFTTMSKFVADNNFPLPTNIMTFSVIMFLVGFLLMVFSNDIKHRFRTNPLQPALTRLETMPTFHGKKLIISGLWGNLRHPNYTGDILVHLSMALPGIYAGRYIAAMPALLTILMLLHRSWRDHTRCNLRYGVAWQRYCKRTPSVIIPKLL